MQISRINVVLFKSIGKLTSTTQKTKGFALSSKHQSDQKPIDDPKNISPSGKNGDISLQLQTPSETVFGMFFVDGIWSSRDYT